MLVIYVMLFSSRFSNRTWLQSPSYPANDVVDPGYLVVRVDVHSHPPVWGTIQTGEREQIKGKRGEGKYDNN